MSKFSIEQALKNMVSGKTDILRWLQRQRENYSVNMKKTAKRMVQIDKKARTKQTFDLPNEYWIKQNEWSKLNSKILMIDELIRKAKCIRNFKAQEGK